MGHILEFLLVPNNFIKLGAVVMERLDGSSLQPTGSHRQDLGLQTGKKWARGAHHQQNHNMGLHRSQRKRFVSCLSSLCSSGVAPVGWRHTLEFWEPSAAQPAHTLGFILEKRAFVLQVTEVHKQLWPDDLDLLTGQQVRCSEHSGPRQLRHKLDLLLFLALL